MTLLQECSHSGHTTKPVLFSPVHFLVRPHLKLGMDPRETDPSIAPYKEKHIKK